MGSRGLALQGEALFRTGESPCVIMNVRKVTMDGQCYELECVSLERCVAVLSPSSLECDLIWR